MFRLCGIRRSLGCQRRVYASDGESFTAGASGAYGCDNPRMSEINCRELDGFRFHVLDHPERIAAFVRRWHRLEWETDHREFPDQPWTVEWLAELEQLTFSLEVAPIDRIRLRPDLMAYSRDGYSFIASLRRRADAMRQAIERGTSIEPLLIRTRDGELMDGYARYAALNQLGARRAYVYLGTSA